MSNNQEWCEAFLNSVEFDDPTESRLVRLTSIECGLARFANSSSMMGRNKEWSELLLNSIEFQESPENSVKPECESECESGESQPERLIVSQNL